MTNRTALYAHHLAAGAKMIDFGGWDMPLHYGSQLNEHRKVRDDAGVFDVSHMCVVDFSGEQTQAFLRHLLANDVARLKTSGKALYSCMLNPQGGVIDDLIVYYIDDTHYRMVVNAGTQDKDIAWMREQAANYATELTVRNDLAMLAIQGPQARAKIAPLLPADLQSAVGELKVFHAAWNEQNWFVARTGYTGEDGVEVMLPETEVGAFWDAILAADIAPIGLGARDTLRLEAGMCLYGSDMDETISPLEAGLNWTVAWEPADRDFIGRAALEAQREVGPSRLLVGLVLKEKGMLRSHQSVIVEGVSGEGEITSGSFSPTMNAAIALARVPAGVAEEVHVQIRQKAIPARVVKPPFVRHGKVCI